jgi:PKD repeat protein
VQFTDASDLAGADSALYSWSFGDGASGSTSDPMHTFTDPGFYSVSLVVTTTGGSDTETKTGLIQVNVPEEGEGEGEGATEGEGEEEGEIVPEGELEGEGEGEEEGEVVPVENAVLFVTQTPFGQDFANIMSTFGNHRGTITSAPRGGDLYIRYQDGTLRNLTAEAGYGNPPIAVRDPYPHWSGTKALFSMVVGGTVQNDLTPVYFQLYEVTGLGQGETVNIRKLAQEPDYNNVTPIYATDGRILFTTDRPRNGERRLYPQLDEYESTPTNTGLWSMNADGSGVTLLDHSPSGDFSPFIDSFGRVIFSRWDHLQRDQQADADILAFLRGDEQPYESVTYASEASDTALALSPTDETFPEQRTLYGPRVGSGLDPLWDLLHPTEEVHTFNHFFPWMISQDGTGLEILNHLGRHELAGYIAPSRTYLEYGGVDTDVDIFLQLCEDPTEPGRYIGTRCPEFGTHAAGQVVAITAPPGENPDDIFPEYLTHPATAGYAEDGQAAPEGHVGMFRDVVALEDGSIWASHSASYYADRDTATNPPSPAPFTLSSRYDFAIRKLVPGNGGYLVPGERLNAEPIVKSITYFDNARYRTVQYNGPMWELQAVELRTQPAPPEEPLEPLPAIERQVLEEELGGAAGIAELQDFLEDNKLALLISRDVTVRGDVHQDFNLKVAGSDHQSAEAGSTPKEIAYMQFYEGQQVRGYRQSGRRVLARTMDSTLNPEDPGAPEGAVRLAADGSMAAFVPAERALSWQSTEEDGTPAVRERYWLTFRAGEIRSCANCHGLNREDVFGRPGPTNKPEALRELLDWWKAGQ